MKNKTKIIFIISIISILSFIMIISTFAVDYPESIELNQGDVIVLKDELVHSNGINLSIYFYSDNELFNLIRGDATSSSSDNLKYYRNSNNGDIWVYNYNNNLWTSNNYKTLTIDRDITITNANAIQWLYDNTLSGPYIVEPNPMYDGTNGFLNSTLQMVTTIISFITTNWIITVFTIGIFIISVTVGILYRLNNKTTKR